MRVINKFFGWLFSLPIYLYRTLISPLFPSKCRFDPSCSKYSLQAIKVYGPWKGTYLALKRILRCHPWGAWGYDPVPKKEEKLNCNVRNSHVAENI